MVTTVVCLASCEYRGSDIKRFPDRRSFGEGEVFRRTVFFFSRTRYMLRTNCTSILVFVFTRLRSFMIDHVEENIERNIKGKI